MAAVNPKLTKMIAAELRNKANEFLNSRRYANNLVDILQMFETETDNYTPLLITIEVLFTALLKRGDLIQEIIPLKPAESSPEAEYTRWLNECYETAFARCIYCMSHGKTVSRLQGLVSACKLLQAEGRYPLEKYTLYYFPCGRLKSIFSALLDSEISMTPLIARFQEFTEYRDVQQYGLKVLSSIANRKQPTSIYMQNYLELMDKLLVLEIPTGKSKNKEYTEEKEEKVFCATEDKPPFKYNPASCKVYVNRGWAIACRWAFCAEPKPRRRALLLLVERLLPLLSRPRLATDMLCDCLDAGGPTSMLALQGILQLVRYHNTEYPQLYERLYSMFEPEMFATRYKRRLVHLADVFLSSTHLPESLVAAFAKRIARLALLASPEDAALLLQLLGGLLLRHPALKRMLCRDRDSSVMASDPYVMEETCPQKSGALGSALWELAALRWHHVPTVAARATAIIDSATGASAVAPVEPVASGQVSAAFDAELRRRFKTIELNFVRPQGMLAPSGERLGQYWELMA